MDDNEKKVPSSEEAPKWERREGFQINRSMKEVIRLSIDLAQAEAARYREKLRKITYGS